MADVEHDDLDYELRQHRQMAAQCDAEARRYRELARYYQAAPRAVTVGQFRACMRRSRVCAQRAREADRMAAECRADAKRELQIVRDLRALDMHVRHFDAATLRAALVAATLRWHPDRNRGRPRTSTARMSRVNVAYKRLLATLQPMRRASTHAQPRRLGT